MKSVALLALFLLGLMTVLLALPAAARDAAPLAVDEAVEKRMVAITEELRCLVCQNESLAGSRADLAQDLRKEIRETCKTCGSFSIRGARSSRPLPSASRRRNCRARRTAEATGTVALPGKSLRIGAGRAGRAKRVNRSLRFTAQ